MNTYLPVLVVDDDPAYAQLVEQALMACQPCPPSHVFHRGADLLAWLATNRRPSLILLDVKMPLTPGFDVLATLRGSDHYKAIPVVMLTVLGQRSDVEKAYAYGANAYIIKPVSFAELQRRINALSPYWTHNDQSSLVRRDFEQLFNQYRRAGYESIQQWLEDRSHSVFTDLAEDSKETDHPFTPVADRSSSSQLGASVAPSEPDIPTLTGMLGFFRQLAVALGRSAAGEGYTLRNEASGPSAHLADDWLFAL